MDKISETFATARGDRVYFLIRSQERPKREQTREEAVERMGQVISLKRGAVAEYNRLHAAVWPEVLQVIRDANIRNYSIFLKEPENLLFAYWEYHGTDFDGDAKKMLEHPTMKRWWQVCTPLQEALATRKPGEWWAMMQQVFFTDL
jgi:L-rhamnose mutarotase